MKKVYSVLVCGLIACCACAQSDDIHFRLQGIWQNDKDSNDVLVITVDSVAIHNMKLTTDSKMALAMSIPNSPVHQYTVYGDSIPLNSPKSIYNTDSVNAWVVKLKADPHGSYDIVDEACYSDMSIAVTGKYLLERYKDKVICYSISEESYSSLKLITRDGTKVNYHIIGGLLH